MPNINTSHWLEDSIKIWLIMTQEWQFLKNIHISPTPDMEINCNCHGADLVEIKCLATLIGKIPSIENYSKHIEKDGNKLKLKSTSPYYS